jgi:type II secretory pathway component GspD/PulD (secretin)
MRLNRELQSITAVKTCALLTLAFVLPAYKQAQAADIPPKSSTETYHTFYLNSLTRQRGADEIQTDLRNMLPKSKIYYVPSQSAISVLGTPEDIQLAQKILSDIDRPKKAYRLTYTITETDNDKLVDTQRYALLVASGDTTALKQGNKVPVVTGISNNGNSGQDSQVQYIDIGLYIEASLDGSPEGLRLHSKVEQSSVSSERSGIGTQDPVIHQIRLDGISTLIQGKPVVVGSLTIPGTTRRQQIEVISELVR